MLLFSSLIHRLSFCLFPSRWWFLWNRCACAFILVRSLNSVVRLKALSCIFKGSIVARFQIDHCIAFLSFLDKKVIHYFDLKAIRCILLLIYFIKTGSVWIWFNCKHWIIVFVVSLNPIAFTAIDKLVSWCWRVKFRCKSWLCWITVKSILLCSSHVVSWGCSIEWLLFIQICAFWSSITRWRLFNTQFGVAW